MPPQLRIKDASLAAHLLGTGWADPQDAAAAARQAPGTMAPASHSFTFPLKSLAAPVIIRRRAPGRDVARGQSL
eukprot:1410142-Pyramimonas_sp.AAC.1